MTVNNTSPAITVTSDAIGDFRKFYISINSISEVDVNGLVVRSIVVSDINFTLVPSISGNNAVNNYSASLSNKASLSVVVSLNII